MREVEWRDRIVLDPAVLVGKPVLKGTRLAVEFVVDLRANGCTNEQITDSCAGVTDEGIRACLAYAKEVLQHQRVFPVAQP